MRIVIPMKDSTNIDTTALRPTSDCSKQIEARSSVKEAPVAFLQEFWTGKLASGEFAMPTTQSDTLMTAQQQLMEQNEQRHIFTNYTTCHVQTLIHRVDVLSDRLGLPASRHRH